LEKDADPEARKVAFATLVAGLKPRIKDILNEEKERLERTAKLSLEEKIDDRSTWFEPSENVIVHNSSGELTSVKPFPGAHAYMRITPSTWPNAIRQAQLSPDGGRQFIITGAANTGDWGATDSGSLHYWWRGDTDPKQSPAMAHWFQQSGVLWGVWSDIIIEERGQRCFYGGYILQYWAKFIRTAISEYRKLGAKGPFRVDAGLVGIQGIRWYANVGEGKLVSASDTMKFTSVEVTEDANSQDRCLTELWNRMTDRFGVAKVATQDEVVALSYR